MIMVEIEKRKEEGKMTRIGITLWSIENTSVEKKTKRQKREEKMTDMIITIKIGMRVIEEKREEKTNDGIEVRTATEEEINAKTDHKGRVKGMNTMTGSIDIATMNGKGRWMTKTPNIETDRTSIRRNDERNRNGKV